MRKFLAIALLFLIKFCLAKNSISDYQRTFLPVYTSKGDLVLAIRVFKINDIPSFLTVNPMSLETAVITASSTKPRKLQKDKPGYLTSWKIASTRYFQLLNKSTAPPYILENQGITRATNAGKANILTIDLCPSSKPFEADFFNKLVELSEQAKKPIPITIAISGLWLIGHPKEFHWLQAKEKEKKLEITWANHSFSHVYYSDLPYSENFLLSPSTNIKSEILLTEKYLLESGEVPSVFFRFPGLVSNKALIKKIKTYGLIPLGTNAWLALLHEKHQEISPGGIILVHGNSNEPKGIQLLLPLLKTLILVDIKKAL